MRIAPLAAGPAAIVVALSWEAAPLARHLRLQRRGVHDGVTEYGRWKDGVLLLQTGMGSHGVARALACLENNPSLLLSAGFCGGVGPEVDLGEIVIGSQVVRNTNSIPADPFLLETATRTLKRIGLPFHVGPILTVDEVVPPTEGGARRKDLQVLAVDMESAYLAEAARCQGVPFLGIRVVSDTAAEPWAAEGRCFLKPDGRLKLKPMAASFLRHPSALLRMIQIASKLRRGMHELAQGIETILMELKT